jgi:hypothetical protein
LHRKANHKNRKESENSVKSAITEGNEDLTTFAIVQSAQMKWR